MKTLYHLLLIAAGGATGTLARYGTLALLQRQTTRYLFPFGTVAVNLAGCFLIGYLQGLFLGRVVRPEICAALTVGFLGGFTTFSAFGLETANYLREGQYVRAGLYVVIQNVAGVIFVLAGYALSRPRP